MNNPNITFAFDMACALVYLIAAPLILLVLFGPAIAKGIQKMQDERFGRTAYAARPSRWRTFINKSITRKNKCPRCEFMNDPTDEYCKKCGTRLNIP